MNRPPRLLPILALVSLAGCGAKTKDKSGEEAADPRIVTVDEKGIYVGGARIGDAPSEDIQKVDSLFAKLKDQREEWKTLHPDVPFDGVLIVDLGPAITCRAAMKVYMTAAFAGYPNATLRQGDAMLNMPAAIPRMPRPGDELAPAPIDAHLVFHSSGEVDVKPRRCGGAFDVVPLASAAATVKELCGQAAECPRAARIQCDPGIPLAKVLPVLQAVQKLSPVKMELGHGGECKAGDSWEPEPGEIPGLGEPAEVPPPPPAGKKRPEGVLREGAVSVTGGLTEAEVRAAVKPQIEAVKACHEAALVRNPNLQGRVAAMIAVGKKGAVMFVKNGGSDLPDNGAVKCILAAMSMATFPAKGQITTIAYPLMLAPK